MTLTNIYRRVLEKLSVLAAGESAAPEDVQLIASKYVTVWNQLKVLDLISWGVTEAVPEEAAESVISAVAFVSADEFDEDASDYVMGAIGLSPPSLAERQLRQLQSQEYVSNPATSEYF